MASHGDRVLEEKKTESREEVIARLLESIPAQQGSAQPVIQDAAGPLPPTRPKFEMPDMTALLARVQSFLPQLQQANTTLPTDHAGKSAFELIEENSDDEEDEGGSKDIKHARDEESDEDSDQDETADVGPQIVMNLALGVLEEKKEGQEADTSSDESSSDEDSSSNDIDETRGNISQGQSSNNKADSESVQITMPISGKGAKQGKKPLIQEMS